MDVIANGVVLGECSFYPECGEWSMNYTIECCADLADHCEHGYIYGHTHAGALKKAIRDSLKRLDFDTMMKAKDGVI